MLHEFATRRNHSGRKVLDALIFFKCDQRRFQDPKPTNHAIADLLPVSLKEMKKEEKAWQRRRDNANSRSD